MRNLKEIKLILKKNKGKLQDKYKVNRIGIFGSYIHGNQDESSDIDILVEFFEPIGWEFIDLKEFIEGILDLKVDLVTPNGLKPVIREKILKDVIYA